MTFSETALGLIVIVVGAVIMVAAAGFPTMAGMTYGPAFFPTLIGAGFVLTGLSLLGSGLLAARGGRRQPWLTLPAWFGDRIAVRRALGIVLAVIAYVTLSSWLGFLITVFLITASLLLLLEAPRWVTAAISVCLPFLLHYGFAVILRVPLPRGPLEQVLF